MDMLEIDLEKGKGKNKTKFFKAVGEVAFWFALLGFCAFLYMFAYAMC